MPGSFRAAVLLGGTVDDRTRADVLAGRRARIDVLELERTLGARLFDFNCLQLRNATNRARAGATIARWSRQWSTSLAGVALPHLRSYDVVYATGEDVGFPLATALRLLGAARPRLVVRLEQPTYGRTLLRRTVFNTYLEYAAARIDRIVCRTAAHVQYLNSVSRIAERHLALVHETTDPAFYAPGADLALVAPAAKPFILAAGLEMRDYPTLIQAVRGQPMSLVIAAGSPWSHFGPGVTDVDQPPNVRVAAFKPLEMRALYRDADLVVVPVKPTLRACGMNVVLEAWAMGKAVIATRTAGLLDYIEDGREAVFVEPRDVEGLRAAIQSLLVQPETRRQLGEAGRQRVEADLNLDAYVQRITAILQNAAS